EVVSSDFLGTRHTGIVDGLATVGSGTNAVVYVWYDNEYGYSCQVLRVMEQMADAQRPRFPPAPTPRNPQLPWIVRLGPESTASVLTAIGRAVPLDLVDQPEVGQPPTP
ncbi:MAG TPA: hypothetical protein VF635_09465, partial [Propionibacteriaceae bacterium]